MKLYYVYILECSDKFLYTGITNNMERRFVEHQKGLNKSCFTFKRRPLELIFYQEFNDVNQAIFFEKKIKKWSRGKKLALANSNFDKLQILSECKNESHYQNRKSLKMSPRAKLRGYEVNLNSGIKLGLDYARPDIFSFKETFVIQNQKINLPILEEKKVELYIKREDLIHPFVSGNKFRKLKYNLQEAKNQQNSVLLTFGGAFSNHIVATAVAGNLNGFKTIGIIRGDELAKDLQKTLANNSTLREAHKNGMTFEFVSREEYRNKSSETFIKQLKEKFGDFYVIPEGGTNELAIKGCEEILTKEDANFDYICSAVGTGGTISGIINATKNYQKVIGFPALKGDFLKDEINQFVNKENWSLHADYHFGGYAKYDEELIHFINNFKKETNVLLDPIYTGKMFFGILDLIENNQFKKGSKILAIHTGGIQGIEGFNQKLKRKNQTIIDTI